MNLLKAHACILLIFLIFLPFRIYGINHALSSINSFREAQTATIALNFYKYGIDLMQTQVDIAGIGPEKYLTLEFPLYEAIVALLYKLFFVSDLWARVVAVAAGYIGAWYLYGLIYLLVRNRTISLLTAFFFLAAPLNMYFQKDILIESCILACLLAGLYYWLSWLTTNSKFRFFLSIFFLTIGFIQKGMYGPFWLIPMAYYSFLHRRTDRRILTLVTMVIPMIVLFFWQSHVNVVNTLHGNSYFTTTNVGHLLWNTGTLEDRISLPAWEFRLHTILNTIFLKPGLLLFLAGLLLALKRKENTFFYVWLGAEVLYFLTFFRIQSHIYYQMILIPSLAFFMSYGVKGIAEKLAKFFVNQSRIYIFSISIVFFCGLYLWRSWISSQWDDSIDWNWYRRLQIVGKVVTDKSFGLLVQPSYDWNSVYSYYIGKILKPVAADQLTGYNLIQWKKMGYSFLILYDYTSFNDVITKTENGQSHLLQKQNLMLLLEGIKVYSL